MNKTQKKEITKALIGLAIILGSIIPLTILVGIILSDMWNWFVVPVGAPVMSWKSAIGISMILNFVKFELAKSKNDDKVDGKPIMFAISRMGGLAAIYVAFWGVGAMWHWAMF